MRNEAAIAQIFERPGLYEMKDGMKVARVSLLLAKELGLPIPENAGLYVEIYQS